MAFNAATAYRDAKILTATPAELTLMLYEGAIKFCNIAIMAIEKGDMENSNRNIIKAEKIILELKSTLKPNISISKDFDNVYNYVYESLIEANIKKDREILDEVLWHLRMMRDTWKEVMSIAKR